MCKLVTLNLMTSKMKRWKLRLVKSLTDGMMSSNTSGMIISSKELLRKRLLIKYKNSSKSQKTKTGGEPSGINSTWGTSNWQINNLKSSTESEVEKWHQKLSPLPITHTNLNIMTPMPLHAHPPSKRNFMPSKWEQMKVNKILDGLLSGRIKWNKNVQYTLRVEWRQSAHYNGGDFKEEK